MADTRMPNEAELIHNVQTKMWSWRKKGKPDETGEVFSNKEEAIRDAKQRHVIESTEPLDLPVIDHELPEPEPEPPAEIELLPELPKPEHLPA